MSIIINEDGTSVTVVEEATTVVVLEGNDSVIDINSSAVVTVIEPETDTVVVGVGTPGPQGVKGDQGPTGTSFEFFQEAPSATWIIVHNLNKFPVAISVYDTADTLVIGSVTYDSLNQITLIFSAPFSGRAELI